MNTLFLRCHTINNQTHNHGHNFPSSNNNKNSNQNNNKQIIASQSNLQQGPPLLGRQLLAVQTRHFAQLAWHSNPLQFSQPTPFERLDIFLITSSLSQEITKQESWRTTPQASLALSPKNKKPKTYFCL
jgi:hypothetical protein